MVRHHVLPLQLLIQGKRGDEPTTGVLATKGGSTTEVSETSECIGEANPISCLSAEYLAGGKTNVCCTTLLPPNKAADE